MSLNSKTILILAEGYFISVHLFSMVYVVWRIYILSGEPLLPINFNVFRLLHITLFQQYIASGNIGDRSLSLFHWLGLGFAKIFEKFNEKFAYATQYHHVRKLWTLDASVAQSVVWVSPNYKWSYSAVSTEKTSPYTGCVRFDMNVFYRNGVPTELQSSKLFRTQHHRRPLWMSWKSGRMSESFKYSSTSSMNGL